MRLSIRESISFTVAIGLPFLVLVGGLIAFLWAGGRADQVNGVNVAYLSGDANVRTCAHLYCQSSGVFKEGQQVVVTAKVTGDSIEGDDTWIEIEYGDERRFIHQSFLMPTTISSFNAFWGYFSIILMLPIVLLYLGQKSERVRRWAVASPRRFDRLLFGGVLCVGLVCGVVGFVYSQLAHEDSMSFVGAAFANLGAGLVGAAVTFVLFQSLLSGRSAEASQLNEAKADLSALQLQLGDLRTDMMRELAAIRSEVPRLADPRPTPRLGRKRIRKPPEAR